VSEEVLLLLHPRLSSSPLSYHLLLFLISATPLSNNILFFLIITSTIDTKEIIAAVRNIKLYDAAYGIDPQRTLPIALDVGTNNVDRLNDPEYVGWRHERITGQAYWDFVDKFVTCINRKLPNVLLLQWEDFAKTPVSTLATSASVSSSEVTSILLPEKDSGDSK
jgi:malic enzyme-like protein